MPFEAGAMGTVDPGIGEANALATALLPEKLRNQGAFFSSLIILILGWWSIILEVFFRYDFGERYLSWVRLVLAACILSVIGWINYAGALLSRSKTNNVTATFTFFTVGFLLCAGLQRWRIWQRYATGEPWHSYSTGISRFSDFIGVDDWTLYLWVEPIVSLVVGILVFAILDGTTGFVIIIGSIALFLKNQTLYFQQKGRILDLIDARIEGEFYNEAAFKKPKHQIAGVSPIRVNWPKNLPPAPTGLDEIQKTVAEAQGKTPPAPTPTVPIVPAAGGITDFADTIADALKPDNKD